MSAPHDSMHPPRVPEHIARWDLDKTYLRTEFDTMKDLIRTAFERADEKRTNPGASTLLREMGVAGVAVHILSGSPEQMRSKLEDKLRLDGITWVSFTLKPNLKNMLRLRFRALRDQLGYKLPALLESCADASPDVATAGVRETLFGDDAEADAFVYSLYGDVTSGRVTEGELERVCEGGRVYEDVAEQIVDCARRIPKRDVVERVLIHLEAQSPPEDFAVYGWRVVPFYNYLQAALVVFEDRRVPAESVLRVALELVVQHRFDGDALARSYGELARRGHLRGERIPELAAAIETWARPRKVAALPELVAMVENLPELALRARDAYRGDLPTEPPNYAELVLRHNRRHKKKR